MRRALLSLLLCATASAGLAQDNPAPAARNANRRAYPPQLPEAQQIIYRTVGEVKLPLYVFNPPGHQPTDQRPAIVFFFGGGWKSGSPGQFGPQCEYFSSRGMVAITADYRVASRHDVKPPECVKDAKAAIRWVRQNAKRLGIDPQKIVASGGSAGGHLAACTGVVPGQEDSVDEATVSSVPNAMALFNPAVALGNLEGRLEIDPEKLAGLKNRLGTDPQLISPAHHVRKNLPPSIIFHGTADSAVPYETVEAFAQLMKQADNRCELVGFEGQPHGFFNAGRGGSVERRTNDDRGYRETVYRLDEFLRSLGYLEGRPTIALPETRSIIRQEAKVQP